MNIGVLGGSFDPPHIGHAVAIRQILDTKKFNDCLDKGTYAEEVAKDLAEGQAAGISGTPGFFVNHQIISGAVPFEVFKAAIEAELAK